MLPILRGNGAAAVVGRSGAADDASRGDRAIEAVDKRSHTTGRARKMMKPSGFFSPATLYNCNVVELSA